MPVLGPLHFGLSDTHSEGCHFSVFFFLHFNNNDTVRRKNSPHSGNLNNCEKIPVTGSDLFIWNPRCHFVTVFTGFCFLGIIFYFDNSHAKLHLRRFPGLSASLPVVSERFSDAWNIPATPRRGPESILAWLRARQHHTQILQGIPSFVLNILVKFL